MADVKPVVKFKTYKQAARVGGKIYGVANLADPVVASVTMQEVIDYAKLHNYSADTLEALLSQVISGVADLVARDGRPRNLSDLLKFEPAIKGTFQNLEQGITTQKIIVRPRMLKEIKLKIAADNFSWQNQNDSLTPVLRSVAPMSALFSVVDLASFTAALATPGFGFTLAGLRLAPNGWDANCSVDVILKPADTSIGHDLHFGTRSIEIEGSEALVGSFAHMVGGEATDNAIALARSTGDGGAAWYLDAEGEPQVYGATYTPAAGDVVSFLFTRTVSTGDTFTVEKSYTL